MTNVREALIARMYEGTWEFIQAFFPVAAGATITATYTPPPETVFIPIHAWTGSQIYYYGIANILVDGEYLAQNIRSTEALEQFRQMEVIYPVRNSLSFSLTNQDNKITWVDFLFFGVLIPESLVDAYMEEVTGRKTQKTLEEIRDLLKGHEFPPPPHHSLPPPPTPPESPTQQEILTEKKMDSILGTINRQNMLLERMIENMKKPEPTQLAMPAPEEAHNPETEKKINDIIAKLNELLK